MFLVALDFEGVLVEGEFLLELAKLAVKGEIVEQLTKAGIGGSIRWTEAFGQRLELLKGVEYEKCILAARALKLRPGAKEFVDSLRRLGAVKVGVITGCFDLIVKLLGEQLGLDFVVANKLIFDDGRLSRVELIVDENKDIHLECIAQRFGIKMSNVIAIGDGANDVKMISKAGLGIAFNSAPVLQKYAKVTVQAERLDALLPVIKDFIEERQKQESSSFSGSGGTVHAKVLVCDAIDPEGINLLKRFGFKVTNKPDISYEELKKEVADYDVLIVRSRTKVTREIIDAGKNLKIIARAGAGVDNIAVDYAEGKGIKVICASEAVANAVAELTVGLMISLARQISRADRAMKDGKWIKSELEGWELCGKTLGIVGCGRIGQRVAQIAKALGMKVLVSDINCPSMDLLNEFRARLVPLEELLRESDVITLHVPLNSQTRHMIGEKEIQQMKDGVYIINTSRGAVMDEKALFEALKSGKVAGAALDVYEKEPPTNYSLLTLPNVVCTSHIGAQTKEAQKDASVVVAKKIIETMVYMVESKCDLRCRECSNL